MVDNLKVFGLGFCFADTLRDLRWKWEQRTEAASAETTVPAIHALVNESKLTL